MKMLHHQQMLIHLLSVVLIKGLQNNLTSMGLEDNLLIHSSRIRIKVIYLDTHLREIRLMSTQDII
jgi:hypothetical protein